MKAEVFYLEEQEELADFLAGALRAKLHPELRVERQRIAFSDQRQVIEMGRRYVKLLQASILPDTGLQLGIRELDHYGYRFYIYVYYAFQYSTTPVQLQAFFPAVAVRNRMALVPAGLGTRLHWMSSEARSALKPFETGGAAEVSFTDRPAVEDALARVAGATRADLLQEVRAYADRRGPGELELPALARDMDVDARLLGSLLESGGEGGMVRSLYRQLTCEIAPSKIVFDRWTKVILSVRNDSPVALARLEAKISGPVEIRPPRVQLDVPAHATQGVPIALKPKDRGEFPLEVVLALPEEQALAPWLPVQHVWVECD